MSKLYSPSKSTVKSGGGGTGEEKGGKERGREGGRGMKVSYVRVHITITRTHSL